MSYFTSVGICKFFIFRRHLENSGHFEFLKLLNNKMVLFKICVALRTYLFICVHVLVNI